MRFLADARKLTGLPVVTEVMNLNDVKLVEEYADLIQIGAYARGSSQAIDEAIAWRPLIAAFLRQPLDQRASFEESVAALTGLAGE